MEIMHIWCAAQNCSNIIYILIIYLCFLLIPYICNSSLFFFNEIKYYHKTTNSFVS